MSGELSLTRRGARTYVERDGRILGYVDRGTVPNPSPRGGAYRVEHAARNFRGKRLRSFRTRRDAVKAIVSTASTPIRPIAGSPDGTEPCTGLGANLGDELVQPMSCAQVHTVDSTDQAPGSCDIGNRVINTH